MNNPSFEGFVTLGSSDSVRLSREGEEKYQKMIEIEDAC